MRRYIIFLLGTHFFFDGSIHCFGQALPIKPARTISFTTDEGTYMDVDISPDGKTLAFNLLGDLFTVPATGGSARQLTRGLDLKVQPVWSPDGKKIAYVSDYSGSWHVNIIDPHGKTHTVIGDPNKELEEERDNIVWAPDGNHIVVSDEINNEYRYAAYGIAGGKIPIEIQLNPFLRFAPDGRTLYGMDSSGICAFDQDTKQRTIISQSPSEYNEDAILSPDARWLSYSVDSNDKRCLVIKDLNTGKSRVLIPSLIVKATLYARFHSQHYCFSPDSKSIYIGYGGKIHMVNVESGEDVIIPFTANVKSDLGPLNYNTYRINYDAAKIKYARYAQSSADGRQLVFSCLGKIYIMDLRGGKPHLLADQPVTQMQPVFSPDGKWVSYVSWTDTVGGFLWRVRAAGGIPEQLTQTPGLYQNPAWSPDGSRVAVIRAGLDINFETPLYVVGRLELVSVSTKEVKTIEDTVPLLNYLSFSSDGHIMYTPVFKENKKTYRGPQLVSKDFHGDNSNVVAYGTKVTEGYVYRKSISPDRRFIVYSFGEDICLLPVFKERDGIVISDYNNQKLSVIRFATGVDPYWEKGGKVLAWTYGNKFYRIDPDKVMAAATKVAFQQDRIWSHENSYVTVDVTPDETIDLNLPVSGNYAHGTIALKNVRIITMQGTKVIDRGIIVVRDGRIQAVGAVGSITVPASARIFDLTGATIMPGLIDLHFHLHLPAGIIPQQSWKLLAGLAYGVTTARDPAAIMDQFGYAELVRSGRMIGPRLFTVGSLVTSGRGIREVRDLGDAGHVVKQRATLGAIVVKNYLPHSPRKNRQWLLMACREAGLNMTNEGDNTSGLIDVGMIKDGSSGVEHNPVWTDIYKDMITFFAESGTYFTPTLQVGYASKPAKEFFNYKYWHQPDAKLARFIMSDPTQGGDGMGASIETIMHAFPKKEKDTLHPTFIYASSINAAIRHAGGRIALGSHGNEVGTGAHNELWALQSGGLTNLEALQAGTIMGAEALGVQKDLGSLEAGKIADLIILNKNPLEDIHNSREIRYVMKDGILYDGDTLDELWPQQKKCPEWKLKTNK